MSKSDWRANANINFHQVAFLSIAQIYAHWLVFHLFGYRTVNSLLFVWNSPTWLYNCWFATICNTPVVQLCKQFFSPPSVEDYLLQLPYNHHNGCDSVSNHQPRGCLLKRLFRRKSMKTSKLRVAGLCAGNSPGTGESLAQMASNAENVSIWWRHHEYHQ